MVGGRIGIDPAICFPPGCFVIELWCGLARIVDALPLGLRAIIGYTSCGSLGPELEKGWCCR